MIEALSMGLDAVQNVSGAIKRAQTEGVGGKRTESSSEEEPAEVGFASGWCLLVYCQGSQHAVRYLVGAQVEATWSVMHLPRLRAAKSRGQLSWAVPVISAASHFHLPVQ